MYPDCIKEIEENDSWVVYWEGVLPEDTENTNVKLKKRAREARKWAWDNYKKGNILIAFRRDAEDNPEYVCKKRKPRQNNLPPRQNKFAPR